MEYEYQIKNHLFFILAFVSFNFNLEKNQQNHGVCNLQCLAKKLVFLAIPYVNEVTLRGLSLPLKCC